MVLLTLAIVLLSLSPLVVTFLHVRFGLKWRANALLGRLDTVLELNAVDSRNLAIKTNLENQLTELYFHVWGFASEQKYEEMKEIHRKKATDASQLPVFRAIYPGIEDEDADSNSGVNTDGSSRKMDWSTHKGWQNLRYHLPAAFLSVIYFVGFLMVLVWYPLHTGVMKQAPAAAPAPIAQPAPTPPATNAADSAGSSGSKRRRAPRETKKPAQDPGDPVATAASASDPQNAASASDRVSASPPGAVNAALPAKNENLAWGERFVRWLQGFLLLCGSIGSSCAALWTACTGGGLDPPSYLIYTFLGAFVFNTGTMVRRIFVWDISGQMFWWASYRVVLSLGLAGVLHFTLANDKLDAHYYFLIAPASVAIFDQLIRNLRAKLLQSDAAPKRNELALQLVQGVDYWKEQRLLEEGIESVQHLATADFVTLALFTRSPLYTIMDWVDQAIFIQRFPGKADRVADAGLPVSAVELAWGWDLANRAQFNAKRPPIPPDPAANPAMTDSYTEYLELLADATGTKPGVVARTLDAWSNDNQVQLLTLFWRADLGGRAAGQANGAPGGV